MKKILALVLVPLLLAASSCGFLYYESDGDVDVVFKSAPAESPFLGYFQRSGLEEFEALISEALADDDDPDRPVRVCAHELLNIWILIGGGADYAPTYGWYSYDSDTLPPQSPILPEEAAWAQESFDRHPKIDRIIVKVEAPWLVEPVREAVARLNEAGLLFYEVE